VAPEYTEHTEYTQHTEDAKGHGEAGRGRSLAAILRDVSREVTGTEIVYTDAQLAEILSPRHFVEVRKTHGGPSPSETGRALGVCEVCLAADDQWLADARARLAQADAARRVAAAAL
jgi:hypothetical protein